MAKSRKQKRLEVKNKKDERKIFTVVAIATLILLVLLYLMYQNM